MKFFKIDESYTTRHKILKVLFNQAQKEPDEQRPKIRVSLSEINKIIKVDERKLFLYHELLHEEKEINCEYDCDNPDDHYLLLESKGRQNYIYEKHLKEGLEASKKEIKDRIDIFAPLISTVIALIALILSIISLNNSNLAKSANDQTKKELIIPTPTSSDGKNRKQDSSIVLDNKVSDSIKTNSLKETKK